MAESQPQAGEQDEERSEALEALAEEFIQRCRAGEPVSVTRYAEQHPEHAEQIRELFPAIAAMERLKQSSDDGPVSLGAARPQRLGDFRIIREVGRGGMGVVYEAEQESLGRRVAIKVLPRQLLAGSGQFVRFAREARLAARLHHTGIVPVFGVGEQDGFHYYVMQLIRGVGLDRVIAALADPRGAAAPGPAPAGTESQALADVVAGLRGRGDGLLQAADAPPRPAAAMSDPRQWRWAASIGLQVAEALHYAHEQGTLHRDIKPANVLVGASGAAWLTDFGLAGALQRGDAAQTQELGGTPRYMAPEQFSGRTDARSDVYSLGLALYEMLALAPAFRDADRGSLMQRIIAGGCVRLRTLIPAIPRDLETIVHKAMEPDPAHRYGSAGAMAADLRSFLEDRPISARRISQAGRLWRWCRRNPAVASLAASTLLLVLAVTAVSIIGYVRTRSALAREAQSRQRAEAVASLATEALDQVFSRLGPSRVVMSSLPVSDLDEASVEFLGQTAVSQETAALLEEMLPFYDRLAGQTGDDAELQRKAADARRRIGDIRQRLGQYEQAIAAYDRAIEMYRSLAAGRAGDALRVSIADVHNEVGKTRLLMRDFAGAQQAHFQALDLLTAPGQASPAARFQLARTHFLLGQRLPREPGIRPPETGRRPPQEGPPGRQPAGPRPRPEDRRGPDADPDRPVRAAHLEQAIALLTSLNREQPRNPEYRHLLALCYRELAPPPGQRSSGAGDKAIAILESLVEEFPQVGDYRLDLCEAYAAVESPPPQAPDMAFPLAEERLRRALAISQQLTSQHPNVPEYLASQARIHHKLGEVSRQSRRLDDAEANDRKAMEIQAQLVRAFPQVITYQVWEAAFRNSLADVLLRRDRLSEARSIMETSISRTGQLLEAHPELWYLHALLMDANRTLALILRRGGQMEQAARAEGEAERHRAILDTMPRGPGVSPTTNATR